MHAGVVPALGHALLDRGCWEFISWECSLVSKADATPYTTHIQTQRIAYSMCHNKALGEGHYLCQAGSHAKHAVHGQTPHCALLPYPLGHPHPCWKGMQACLTFMHVLNLIPVLIHVLVPICLVNAQ